MSVDNLKRDLLVQWRHILRWRGQGRSGQVRAGERSSATSLPVNNSGQDRTVAVADYKHRALVDNNHFRHL